MEEKKDLKVATENLDKEIKKRMQQVKNECGKMQSSFFRFGFNIYWFNQNKRFKNLAYKNIYEMAQKEFTISRGVCCSYLRVVERFAKRVDGIVVEEIDERFQKFNTSQLIEMLPLSTADALQMDNTLPVRELRKAVKKLTPSEKEVESKPKKVPHHQKPEEILVESKTINRKVISRIESVEDFELRKEEIVGLILKALQENGHSLEIAYDL